MDRELQIELNWREKQRLTDIANLYSLKNLRVAKR